MTAPFGSPQSPWWEGAAIYQVYVRSWQDSNGDGIGDLAGVTERLDYLSWLGIEAIWLSPIHPSPNCDFGYDVSDYYGVHPDLGTEKDLATLVEKAAERGIVVILDLVPNHTSDAHPWFVEALGDPDSPKRDFYVWADPKEGGGPPNNWLDETGSCAWTLDPASGQYYLHNFLPSQPDLNWWNPVVQKEFEAILAYWFDKGIGGFRIDVAHGLVKDAELRDNPPAEPGDHPLIVKKGLRPVYNVNRPEVHPLYRRWRSIADSYVAPRLLLGETWVLSPEELAPYYGQGDELHLGFNFSLLFSPFSPLALAGIVERTLASLPEGAHAVWTGSNHDVSRMASRWAGGEPTKARLALGIICLLPGTVVLYYGDELGMVDVDLDPSDLVDDMSRKNPASSRDRSRTPMQWSAGLGCGFTTDGVRSWLPMGDCATTNVEQQRQDRSSLLWMCRDLLELRRSRLGSRTYRQILLTEQLWCWSAGQDVVVVANFSRDEIALDPLVAELIWTSWQTRGAGVGVSDHSLAEAGHEGGGPESSLAVPGWGLAVLRCDEAMLVEALGGEGRGHFVADGESPEGMRGVLAGG